MNRLCNTSVLAQRPDLCPSFADGDAPLPSSLSYRGQLSEGTEGPRGRGQGGSSLEGAGKGRLWSKGSRKGVDRGPQRINTLLSHLSCM